MKIEMSSPDITQAEFDAVMEVLQTRWLSFGPKLKAFEAAFSSYIGTDFAVGVNSGTSGLHLCMIAAGIKPGDEVITSPFSFVASSNCILYERGVPVFVDIDPETTNMNPDMVESVITERTRAIVVVHAFGQPSDMDPIIDIARRHNLFVIEDACEAVGAEYNGRRAGTLGDAAVFAFYPNKQMTTGEGGIITTNREDWQKLFLSLRNQGRDEFNSWLSHVRLGYNYRLDELSAALGLAQIERVEELIQKRDRVSQWYNERIAEIEGVEPLVVAKTTTRMSWFVYVVRLGNTLHRDTVITKLAEIGIPSRGYFSPIHLQPFYQEQFGWKRGDFPITEAAGDSYVALPFSGLMTEAEVNYVCQNLEQVLVS